MDLDQRSHGNRGTGNRIILLGDGTEITTEATDADMFDNDEEDNDLDSQVNKFNNEGSNGSAREETPGPQGSTAKEATESPSSVKTEKSEGASADKDASQPDKITAGTVSSGK